MEPRIHNARQLIEIVALSQTMHERWRQLQIDRQSFPLDLEGVKQNLLANNPRLKIKRHRQNIPVVLRPLAGGEKEEENPQIARRQDKLRRPGHKKPLLLKTAVTLIHVNPPRSSWGGHGDGLPKENLKPHFGAGVVSAGLPQAVILCVYILNKNITILSVRNEQITG